MSNDDPTAAEADSSRTAFRRASFVVDLPASVDFANSATISLLPGLEPLSPRAVTDGWLEEFSTEGADEGADDGAGEVDDDGADEVDDWLDDRAGVVG